MIADKADYLDNIENLLNDTHKFEKSQLKNDGFLNFAANQEKSVENDLLRLIVYLRKHARNVARKKYRFAELVVIPFTFNKRKS